jgi:hypothetical protein
MQKYTRIFAPAIGRTETSTISHQRDSEIIAIMVEPCEGRPGFFVGAVDGYFLCRSRQPFLDGARTLLERGCRPDAVIEMWHAGATAWALQSTIGKAAGLTVAEEHGTRFERWKPFSRAAIAAPVRQNRKRVGGRLGAEIALSAVAI